ncbi:MAG TPA: ABC transporter permease [Polyangiaceae bacterium]|nr:ABC transporter permease [Polyangiaceae bacterium]
MPFEWFVALRYMRDARGQTTLILAAVSVGVSVVVFLSALIDGLQASLIEKTLGSQAHVTLQVPREAPRALVPADGARAIAAAVQPASQRLRSIDDWPSIVAAVERLPGVTAASPMLTGAGFGVHSDAKSPIRILGIDPERFLPIIDVRKKLTEGRVDVAGGQVVLGSALASELGAGVGDKVRITTTEGIEDVVTIAGLFTLGNRAVDETWVLTSLRHAQSLFALPGGVTTIELKVADVFDAERVADEIRDRTGLRVDSWMNLNAELLQGLSAQSNSKNLIEFFVALAVALGIASVLIVSVVQKSREIGILRAVGTPGRRVLLVFLIQGGVLGFGGSLAGSALGAAFAWLFERTSLDPSGTPRFPVRVDLPLLLFATGLATGIGLLSAVIPARRASRLEPATAIRNV